MKSLLDLELAQVSSADLGDQRGHGAAAGDRRGQVMQLATEPIAFGLEVTIIAAAVRRGQACDRDLDRTREDIRLQQAPFDGVQNRQLGFSDGQV